MTKTKCPACGRGAEGRFCSWCGAALGGVSCPSCGAEGEPGGRFCNDCGAPLGAAAGVGAGAAGSGGGRDSRLVWGVAGILLVALILAVGLPMVRSGEGADGAPRPAPAAAPAGGQAGGPPDLSQMTPRQAADRLYDRIMSTASAGDSADAAFFLPMGIDAYEMARPLDADGLFHLSLLQRMAGDPEAGLATAREALAVHPNHLLNLASAGGAAAETGDTATARDYYRAFLDSYESEMAKGLPEYQLHQNMMPELRQDAESFLDG